MGLRCRRGDLDWTILLCVLPEGATIMGSEDHPRPNSQAGSEGTSALRSHAGTYPRTIFIDLRVQRSCMKNSQGRLPPAPVGGIFKEESATGNSFAVATRRFGVLPRAFCLSAMSFVAATWSFPSLLDSFLTRPNG